MSITYRRAGSGGTAFDFAQPGSEISEYLHENGYNFGPSAVEDDFYDAGLAHGRFEEELAENEMKRRMMMEESAINLEVDLSSLGLDEKFEVSMIPFSLLSQNADRSKAIGRGRHRGRTTRICLGSMFE